MSPSDEQVLAAIAEQAGAWYVQNRSGPLDNEARANFVAWLRASPLHVQEYLGVTMVAGDLPAASRDSQVSLESLLAEARADARNVVSFDRPSSGSRSGPELRVSRAWPIAVAAAASIVLAVSAVIWSGRDGEKFGLPKAYSTAHGEQSVRQLPDGSVLHLNTDSRVTVRYSSQERVVELDRGEALFQVAHEGQRSFRVATDEAGILAVGTKFDVYRRSGTVTVAVVEGAVVVFTGAPPHLPTSELPPTALRLGAGYQVEVDRQIGTPRPVDARAAVAWVHRQIAFEGRPLGEVADEFNRYGRISIQIDDPALRALPISGVFDAYDVDSFAAFLETLGGVVVQKTPTRIHVTKATSASREQPPVAQ